MNEIEKHASDNVVKILVGNKCDLESQRQVSFEEGQELADHYGVRFIETSAKDSKNVEKTYALMTHWIMTKLINGKVRSKVNGGSSDAQQPQTGCCHV